MSKLYDKNPIYDVTLESYVGYGKNDLSKMTKAELEKEMARTTREIKDIEDEIGEADSFPSYVLKEKLINAKDYEEKIAKAISELENPKVESFVDNELSKLSMLFSKGLITESYYNKYTKLLNDKKSIIEKSIMESTEEVEPTKKSGFIKKFKKTLSDYSRK